MEVKCFPNEPIIFNITIRPKFYRLANVLFGHEELYFIVAILPLDYLKWILAKMVVKTLVWIMIA